MKKAMKLVFTAMLVTAFGLGLSGCRDEEQNRVLNYQKGTYLGAQDQSYLIQKLTIWSGAVPTRAIIDEYQRGKDNVTSL